MAMNNLAQFIHYSHFMSDYFKGQRMQYTFDQEELAYINQKLNEINDARNTMLEAVYTIIDMNTKCMNAVYEIKTRLGVNNE